MILYSVWTDSVLDSIGEYWIQYWTDEDVVHSVLQFTYPDSNSNEFCDYQFQHHVDATLLGRLRY